MDRSKIGGEIFWQKLSFLFYIFLIVLLTGVLIIPFFVKGFNFSKIIIGLAIVGFLPVFWSVIKGFLQKKLTIDALAGLALVISFIEGEWHSAVFICLMLAWAKIFYLWTAAKEKKIIDRLLKFRPEIIKIKVGNKIKEISISDIKKGDQVVIESGGFIPVDGVVISGQAEVNEAMLTGESELKAKKIGDTVLSSTVNESGSLLVLAEKVGKESFFEKTLELVESASRKKGKTERIADKFAFWYVILVFVSAGIIFFFFRNFGLVLSVLLVTCADDIAVAVPLSFTIALSIAAKGGVLIKGSDALEKIPKIKFFITDKTGTLTYGRPKVRDIIIFNGITEKDFLEKVGFTVLNSHHPVSMAITEFLRGEKIGEVAAPDKFLEFIGAGLEAEKDGNKVLVGKLSFLQEKGISISGSQATEINQEIEKGLSVMIVAVNGEIAGVIVYEDEVRPFSLKLIEETKKMGVRSWVLLTGDNERVAKKISDQLGISNYHANLKPEEKLRYIENFKINNSGISAMIGDGVNDVASLSMVDVSFSMAKIGTDAAIEASDVALLNDKLERIPETMFLANKTMQTVRQHFLLWAILNIIGLVLVFIGVLHPIQAAAYNFITDFIPILNALRLTRVDMRVGNNEKTA